jgi:protoporphyrin/coproporphyrin ferrochelatase
LKNEKQGVLLINLGTPASPSRRDVRRYLREFLSDPHVIDIPAIARWLLLNLLILPLRPFKSSKAYQAIWSKQGSPLLVESINLSKKLQRALGPAFHVTLGMRYQRPSIETALMELKQSGCDDVLIIPLYPQYALSTTHSSIEKTEAVLNKIDYHPNITTIKSFYNHPEFIEAYANIIQPVLDQHDVDVILFSYHGLPVRHIEKVHCQHLNKHCQDSKPCPIVTQQNQHCYRAQCYATTRAIIKKLQLEPSQYRNAFQSRLGRTPWIQPYTDNMLTELAQQGIKNIAIVCPAFVADCLETLEEIGMQAQEQWKRLGGHTFHLIPCLNSHPHWIAGLKKMIVNNQ